MIIDHAGFELDDDPARVDRDAVWAFLSTEAYWGRSRVRPDLDVQVDGAWRIVGVYDGGGATGGFARAVAAGAAGGGRPRPAPDGVAFAYLADVYVLRTARGHGLGTALVRFMIDDGPGRDFRWTLFTGDAHGLYALFGFAAPDGTAMVRPPGLRA